MGFMEIRFILCCDVDPYSSVLGGARLDAYKDKLVWKGLSEGISPIEKLRESIRDSYGTHLKITWFFRSDEQIHTIYGDYSWAIEEFRGVRRKLESRGDEIGWHPHLWRWNENNGCWYQEIEDKEWMRNCLENGFCGFKNKAGFPYSVRMGWDFHNNFTMNELNNFGILVDLSATPGVRRKGTFNGRGSFFVNECDWQNTPDEPYFPSKIDYRRPVKGREKYLKILEIPITTYVSFKHFFGRIIKAHQFSFELPKVRLSPLASPWTFKSVLGRKIKIGKESKKDVEYVAAYFHTYDLIKFRAVSNLRTNLMTTQKISKNERVSYRFQTARESAETILREKRS